MTEHEEDLESRADASIAHPPLGQTAEVRAAVFTETRPLLFAIAYRMLGSVADAEDLVQEAYLRWQQAPADEIRAPRAYLTTIVTRLAINQLRSARRQRESYVGPWLPEPLMTEHAPDPSEPIELAESLSMAFLVMLERLSPVERAVLLLYDVFDFGYDEIARILDKSEANCRQLLSRAKKHLGSAEPRFEADRAEAERLMQLFTRAAGTGDIDGMLAVLADDITLYTDGGGKARGAVLHPLHGADAVARFVIAAEQRFASAERTVRPARINGEPGFIVHVNGEPHVALIFHISERRIRAIYSISNQDKLRSLRGSA